MKRIFGMIAMAALLVVSACSTSNTSTSPVASNGSSVADTIALVQEKAKDVCNFLPAAETVAAIIGAYTGQTSITSQATKVANTICDAVVPKSGKAGVNLRERASGVYGNVNGVPIKGEFVK